MSGASVAYHLLEMQEETKTTVGSVVVLEAREVCSGATGRNGEPFEYLVSHERAADHTEILQVVT